MKNIAHRGFSGIYPENTLLSFQKAIELEVDMIELDTTLTKDKIPIVIHDDTLERTTNGAGEIRKINFKQIEKLDAGSWKSEKFKLEKIPTLEEVIKLIKPSKVYLNIEIKSSAYEKKINSSSIEFQVIKLIQKYKLINRITISSFEPKILLRLRSLSAKAKLAYLIEPNFEELKLDPIAFVKKINGVSLNMHKSQINKKIFNEARKAKIPVFVYTVNSEREMKNLIKKQIDGIFTNYPNKLKNIEDSFN